MAGSLLLPAQPAWRSPYALANQVYRVAVADTDADTNLEVHGLGSDGNLHIFDGKSGKGEAVVQGRFTALAAAGGPGAKAFLLLGDDRGQVWLVWHDGKQYRTAPPVGAAGGRIYGLTLLPFPLSLWVGAERRLRAIVPPGVRVWESYPYGNPFGSRLEVLVRGQSVMGVVAGYQGLAGYLVP